MFVRLYLLDRNELSGAYEAIEEVMVTGQYHTCFVWDNNIPLTAIFVKPLLHFVSFCLVFSVFLDRISLFPIHWYVLRFDISQTILSGHLSIWFQLTSKHTYGIALSAYEKHETLFCLYLIQRDPVFNAFSPFCWNCDCLRWCVLALGIIQVQQHMWIMLPRQKNSDAVSLKDFLRAI